MWKNEVIPSFQSIYVDSYEGFRLGTAYLLS